MDNDYTLIPESMIVADITASEFAVLSALLYFARSGDTCEASQSDIADIANVSPKTARRALNNLRAKGIVTWEHQQNVDGGNTVNIYTIHSDAL